MDPVFVAVPTIFGIFGFVIWTITVNIRQAKVAQTMADFHGKVLEKCSSSQELLGYVQSEAGRRFLEMGATNQSNPTSRVLNAVQTGTILSMLGGAAIVVSNFRHDVDVREACVTMGALVLAAGLGFLISAAVSYVLCKSWGLLNQAEVKI